ncbi:hypothetical protein BB560_006144 [Smittium megazygosporum]|uniref:Uncharacterized protein n=1 Tax=Smittium megazygosporum TaxID=133381 RepID=A0A2T9YFQ5_9FUNG|nr:hypothetical protein BB560_006144 [Smittium megazygosporum]
MNNARGFQTLPRHLRRRAASHNIKRIPMRLRARTVSENKKSQVKRKTSNSKETSSTSPNGSKKRTSVMNRKHRRKPKTLLEEYTRRQNGKRWLPTHIWHTKRMKMANKWGIMIAQTPNDKSHRAIYRSMNRAIIHDTSYFRTLELKGSVTSISLLLRKLTLSELKLDHPYYLNGSMTIPMIFYENQNIQKCIGPVLGVWGPSIKNSATPVDQKIGSDKLKSFLIRIHPAAFDLVFQQMQKISKSYSKTCSVDLSDLSLDIASIDVLGLESIDVLTQIVKYQTLQNEPTSSENNTSKKIWDLLSINSNSNSIPENTVIYLDAIDPRLGFPQKLKKSNKMMKLPDNITPEPLENISANESVKSAKCIQEHYNSEQLLDENNSIWNLKFIKGLVEKKQSENDLNVRRSKMLIPGSKLPFTENDSMIPIMLIKKDASHYTGTLSTNSKKNKKKLVSGWTLVCPSGFVLDFWKSLVFIGGKAIGINEENMLAFESKLPSYPRDWPMTHAYNCHFLGEREDIKNGVLPGIYEAWVKKPKSKRINFEKFGVKSPFYPPLHLLCGLDEPAEFRKFSLLEPTKDPKASDELNKLDTKDANEPKQDLFSPWLVCFKPLSTQIQTMVTSFCPKSSLKTTFSEWVQPLAKELMHKKLFGSHPDLFSTEFETLLKHSIISVFLKPIKRGVPKPNAAISINKSCKLNDTGDILYGNLNPFCDTEIHVDSTLDSYGTKHKAQFPKQSDTVGYVIYGDYSYSESTGLAIGACSLEGLYKIWKSSAKQILQASAKFDKAVVTEINENSKDQRKALETIRLQKIYVDVTNTDGNDTRVYSLSIV